MSQRGPRHREGGIEAHGFAKVLDRLRPLRGREIDASPDKSQTAEIDIVGLEIARWFAVNQIELGGSDPRLQLIGDRPGDFALDGKDILERAIVNLRPLMRVSRGVDQLR